MVSKGPSQKQFFWILHCCNIFAKRIIEDNLSSAMYRMKPTSLGFLWAVYLCLVLIVFLKAPIDPIAVYSWESKSNFRAPFALSILYLVIIRGEILNNEGIAKTVTSQTVKPFGFKWVSVRISRDYLLQKFISLEPSSVVSRNSHCWGCTVGICQPWDCTKTDEPQNLLHFWNGVMKSSEMHF